MFVAISRRLFLAGGVSLGARAVSPPKQSAVYAFTTERCDVRMSVEFHDRYSTRSFSFRDLSVGRRFCLSKIGEDDPDCTTAFVGSLAIARYSFRPHSGFGHITTLREHVRTIDQDNSLRFRPPFDRVIELREGVASDIQAFGYETASTSSAAPMPDTGWPWYYFRQDLYLPESQTAFLVVHWRHTFNAVRILDAIPGDGTSPLDK